MKLIDQQKKYFELLTSTMGSPVLVYDGKEHKEFYGKQKRPYTHSKLHEKDKLVNDIIRYDEREIIIESDSTSWIRNYRDGKIIKSWLEGNEIPYVLNITGGKGMRFHIYLGNTNLTQNLIFFLYAYICEKAMLNWKEHGVPENKSKHHLLGTFGKKGKYGFYSTYATEIPKKRPETQLSEVKFPDKIELWNVPDEFLEEAIEFGKSIEQESKRVLGNKKYFRRALLIIK